MTLLIGVITPLTTGGGPTLYQPQPTLLVPTFTNPNKNLKKNLGFAAAVVFFGSPKKNSPVFWSAPPAGDLEGLQKMVGEKMMVPWKKTTFPKTLQMGLCNIYLHHLPDIYDTW